MKKSTREEVVARQIAHYRADEYQRGNRLWCDVGCHGQDAGLDNPYDHRKVAEYLGNAPMWYAHLRDVLFERLPGDGTHVRRMIRLTQVMPWDADDATWDRVLAKTMLAAMQIAARHSSHESVMRVVALCERWASGDKPDAQEWTDAAAAAAAAETMKARAAEASEAAWAARSVAYTEICVALESAMSAETGLRATVEGVL
jgi:hypothetical protein